MCSYRFCLDNESSLDRDQAFAGLQSRLIRYETQTTCSKEPCALSFALSPAPSPAVTSEPGSVPDGDTLQNSDVAPLKRKSWETDVGCSYPRKRYRASFSSRSAGCGVIKTQIESLTWNMILHPSDQGWWSRRAMTLCVLKAAAAAAHAPTSGLSANSQSDSSPPRPLAHLQPQDGHQVKNWSLWCDSWPLVC